MNIETKWLEDFIALSELNNFSKAAKARCITQPAFSRHIKSLEDAIGIQLINREVHPIRLTAAGKQFRTTARNLLQQLGHSVNQLKHSEFYAFTPIRIAAPHSLASPCLINLMDEIHLGYELAYSIDVMRVDLGIKSLTNGENDLLFSYDEIKLLQPPFQNIPIGEGHFVLVSAIKSDGKPLYDPRTQATLPLQRYSSESYAARMIENHIGSQLGFKYTTCFESSMPQLQKEMVMRGKGLAWLPTSLIAEEIKNKQLYLFSNQEWNVPYHLRIYRNQTSLSEQGEAFWNRLKAQVNKGWQLENSCVH